MNQILYISDFKIDKEKRTLFGVLYKHEPSLLSYKVYSKRFPKVKGFVFEYFEINKNRVSKVIGYNVPDGTFFGTIHIKSGWEFIESGEMIDFLLKENKTKVKSLDLSKVKLRPGQIFVKYKKMNKPNEFTSFFIDLRGGSTEGAGRNEYGKPHFHLKNKNSLQDIGKIDIPDIETWNKSIKKIDLLIVEGGSITKKEKKEIVDWLEKDNNKNLERLLAGWNEMNKFNKRAL